MCLSVYVSLSLSPSLNLCPSVSLSLPVSVSVCLSFSNPLSLSQSQIFVKMHPIPSNNKKSRKQETTFECSRVRTNRDMKIEPSVENGQLEASLSSYSNGVFSSV